MLFKSLAAVAASAALVAGLPTAPPPPAGGVDVNATAPPPEYKPMSDFDFQSLNLALNQEWIGELSALVRIEKPAQGAHVARFLLLNHSELDLFHYGLARFSEEEFEAAGINAEDRFLIQFMAE
jgi:hypothetical protein